MEWGDFEPTRAEQLEVENNRLEAENDQLRNELYELKRKLNYSKENELLEFLRNLYEGVKIAIEGNEDSIRIDVIFKNLKLNIEDFAKVNKIKI